MAKKIKVNATATFGDIAKASGKDVTEYDVKKHFRINGIDRDFDIALNKFRTIQTLRKENPDITPKEASVILTERLGRGYSKKTIENYWRKEDEPSPIKYIGLSLLDAAQTKFAMATVSDEDRAILNIILQLYLRENPKFDCDLTFSKGDFYRQGVPYPRYCFDLYPEQPKDLLDAPYVYPLRDGDNIHSAENCLKNDSVSSIIIDLPQEISVAGESSSEAFADIRDLALSYYKMLDLAYKKLRPLSETDSGGILVVKVGDIKYKGKWIWVSNIISEIATGHRTQLSDLFYDEYKKIAKEVGKDTEQIFPSFNFELVDKYIHKYSLQSFSQSNLEDGLSVKMHDYFLVFRKGEKEEHRDTYYFSSSVNNPEIALSNDLWISEYGPVVASRLSYFKSNINTHGDIFNFEIGVLKKTEDNHIKMNALVSNIIVKKINEIIEDVIPFNKTLSGKIFLEYLNDILRKKRIKENPKKYILPREIFSYTIEILKQAGIKFIEIKSDKKNQFEDNVRILINFEDMIITPI